MDAIDAYKALSQRERFEYDPQQAEKDYQTQGMSAVDAHRLAWQVSDLVEAWLTSPPALVIKTNAQ